ncbi:MAG: hypothetical protein ACI95C_002468 [Pseudohongiellaceae bacterium]|jgi:hypothetical protein
MKFSILTKIFPSLAIALVLGACQYSVEGRGLTNNLYCDNFLLYKMCASDPNRDGVVDYVYFESSEAVFMYTDNGLSQKPDEQPMHRCAEVMEDDLVEVTSRLFYVDDDTPTLEKTDIRGAMTIRYLAKLPEIAACNMRAEQAEELQKKQQADNSVTQS